MLKLWRYKKLANDNGRDVKEEKVIDDEDYNSCFQLRKNLKVSDFSRGKIEILIFLQLYKEEVDNAQSLHCG
jgi:hypothetical protein